MSELATSLTIPAATGADRAIGDHAQSLRGLDWVNFFLADVQSGVGPFVAVYLAAHAWNKQEVGMALAVGGLAGIVTQTFAGALVDRSRHKRALIAWAVVALAVGALALALFPTYWPVMATQTLVGTVSSVFNPAIAAISLGIVGRACFDRRQGRNQAFNSAGNVVGALLIGAIAYYFSNLGIFIFVILVAGPTLAALSLVRPQDIDDRLARNLADGKSDGRPESLWDLVQDRALLVFLLCAVMFHFANAAMLPLLGEMLGEGKGRGAMPFMSACVITTQLVATLVAPWSGKLAGTWGSKTLLLIGFAVLPVRGVLYTLTDDPVLLVLIQALDGIGVGIFNVVAVLVIADLTQGTGRFNLAQGAIGTAVGTGAALSQAIAGAIVHHAGYEVGFLFLAGVAAAALGMLFFLMPETAPEKSVAA